MRTPQPKPNSAPIQEITGKPANLISTVFGRFFLPGTGIVTLKISADLLYMIEESFLHKRESWLRIQTIHRIEIIQVPIWTLLAMGLGFMGGGFFLLKQWIVVQGVFLLLGLTTIAAFFLFKHRYLCIHSNSTIVFVSLTKPPQIYQQFAISVLAFARQLNTPRMASPPPTDTTSGRSATGGANTTGRSAQGTPAKELPANSQANPNRNTTGRNSPHTTQMQ